MYCRVAVYAACCFLPQFIIAVVALGRAFNRSAIVNLEYPVSHINISQHWRCSDIAKVPWASRCSPVQPSNFWSSWRLGGIERKSLVLSKMDFRQHGRHSLWHCCLGSLRRDEVWRRDQVVVHLHTHSPDGDVHCHGVDGALDGGCQEPGQHLVHHVPGKTMNQRKQMKYLCTSEESLTLGTLVDSWC